ncbi:MAG: viral A-type inclusion protein [Niabella sp.]
MRFAVILLLVGALASCNSSSAPENEPAQSLSDSLLTEVLAGHDVAMPKMMKLERLQKEAQNEADSLRKKGGANPARIKQLDSLVHTLSQADGAMHAWMNGFKYDSLKDNEVQREAYLKGQLAAVNKMKDLVVAGIQKADSVLAK